MDLSIAVCTYNRADILDGALRSLCNQTADKNNYEVIVVDNVSRDNTQEVANRYLGCLNMLYAYEVRQGLSNARNRAIELSKARYLAYIDDDIRVCPEWVSRILFVIKEFTPDIFGGPIYPLYRTKKPTWFLDKYATFSYWGDNIHPLTKNEYLSGGNIIFRKELFKNIGKFKTTLGMSANTLGYHEETEIVARARQVYSNIKVLYASTVLAYHLVHRDKISTFWYIKQSRYLARSNIVFHKEKILSDKTSFAILIFRILYHLAVILFKATAGISFRDRGRFRYWQNYFMECIMPNVNGLYSNVQILFLRVKYILT